MSAKAVMVQGTASHVGKSVLTAALCRIFQQDGYRVAPFKSQNMALNSFVTHEGGEMGRAQVFQAKACKIPPTIDMNPILLKPTSDVGAQVVVRGKPIGNMVAEEYHRRKPELMGIVRESYNRLAAASDIVVIEGAGSPAEVNLRDRDIVNMPVAEMAQAAVLLVANIDIGGVFAQIIGTLDLLRDWERALVKGIIINKFRGDLSLFLDGVEFIEQRTGVPVLGVVPYFTDIPVEEEDSLAPERAERRRRRAGEDQIDIAVVFLPHVSNFTDFDALEREPDVVVRYVRTADELDGADCIILPGSKSTIGDLLKIREVGIERRIKTLADDGTPVVGICGGYQMLGTRIFDPLRTESELTEVAGMGLLNVETRFAEEKTTAQTKARAIAGVEFVGGVPDTFFDGYEIHAGVTTRGEGSQPILEITERQGCAISEPDGAVSGDGHIWGCYLHGMFDSRVFRRQFVNDLRRRKGLAPLEVADEPEVDPLDELAKRVRENLNMPLLYQCAGLSR
ncbi:MAG: cobyric acid synthase [Armatimonadetes bacterium]|nr:cobyric acid synthase [Armatimonadota bacterium]